MACLKPTPLRAPPGLNHYSAPSCIPSTIKFQTQAIFISKGWRCPASPTASFATDVASWYLAEYVLYWALANRRLDSNRAFQFAADLANHSGLPLLVYEALTCDH